MAQTPKIERKYAYLLQEADWRETFEAEIAAFPLSKFADQVDSMVHSEHALNTHNRLTARLSALPLTPVFSSIVSRV